MSDTPIEYDRRTGDVTIHAGGVEVRLPYPTFGQFRKAMELDQARADTDRELLAEVRAATPDASPTSMFFVDAKGRCLQWWADVATLLDVADFPPTDALPPWLASIDVIAQTVDHWCSFPFVAPGVPAPPPVPETAAAET